ncbi:hypothetical protein V2I01_33800 [Micromonospora sp. BRA006-A]|nr:hypothetical protein [Micromonospora sp. BRA006-A]
MTLRVPDRIAAGVTGLGELAEACGADAAALGRLLRYLVHRGVFVEVSPDVFGLTDVGELLCDRDGGGHGAYLDPPASARGWTWPGRACRTRSAPAGPATGRCTGATSGPTSTPTRTTGPTSTR